MKKNINNNFYINIIEYVSLFLVLSFILLHNIYMVFIGITLALSLINIKKIELFIKFIFEKEFKKTKDKDKIKNISYTLEETKEDSSLSLVEILEESGYIPSDDNFKENNAA